MATTPALIYHKALYLITTSLVLLWLAVIGCSVYYGIKFLESEPVYAVDPEHPQVSITQQVVREVCTRDTTQLLTTSPKIPTLLSAKKTLLIVEAPSNVTIKEVKDSLWKIAYFVEKNVPPLKPHKCALENWLTVSRQSPQYAAYAFLNRKQHAAVLPMSCLNDRYEAAGILETVLANATALEAVKAHFQLEGWKFYISGSEALELSTGTSSSDLIRMDGISIPVGILILAIVVKCLKLIICPLISMPCSIVVPMGIMYIVSRWWSVNVGNVEATMGSISIALSIDYVLFLTSRFSSECKHNPDYRRAAWRAFRFSGENIFISGCTIATAFLGLLAYPVHQLRSMGISFSVAVLGTMLVNLTFIPSFLFTFAKWLQPQPWPSLLRKVFCCKASDAEKVGLLDAEPSMDKGGSHYATVSAEEKHKVYFKIAVITQRYPIPIVLLFLALLGPAVWSVSNLEPSISLLTETHRANAPFQGLLKYHQLDFQNGVGLFPAYSIALGVTKLEILGPNNHSTLIAGGDIAPPTLADIKSGHIPIGPSQGIISINPKIPQNVTQLWDATNNMIEFLANTSHIPPHMFWSGAFYNASRTPPGKDKYWWLQSYSERGVCSFIQPSWTSIGGNESRDIQHILLGLAKFRYTYHNQLSNVTYWHNHKLYKATFNPYLWAPNLDDYSTSLHSYGNLPSVALITYGVVLLIVLVAFKSIAIAIILIGTMMYTLVVSFGVFVLIFQTPILHWIPPLRQVQGVNWQVPILAASFISALALDYGVFLLTRIKEYRMKGYTDHCSIMLGLATTGGIISAAGLIMAVAFSGLFIDTQMLLNQLAFLLTFSVLLDTFCNRIFLLPALLALCTKVRVRGFGGETSLLWWPCARPVATRESFDIDFNDDNDNGDASSDTTINSALGTNY